MKTKFIAISLGVALLLASNVSSVADASWLSKAMERLETSNAKLHQLGPKRSNIVIIGQGKLLEPLCLMKI